MTAVEMTSESFKQVLPNVGKKIVHAKAAGTNAGDFITFTDLKVVEGVLSCFATDGTAGTYTIAGTDNKVTFTNGNGKTWNVVVIGY